MPLLLLLLPLCVRLLKQVLKHVLLADHEGALVGLAAGHSSLRAWAAEGGGEIHSGRERQVKT